VTNVADLTGPELQPPEEVRRGPDGRIAVLLQLGKDAEWKWVEIGAPGGQFTVWLRDHETVAQWRELE
jgi:hypothetical protein